MKNSFIGAALAVTLMAGCTAPGQSAQNTTTTQTALARADETRGAQAQAAQGALPVTQEGHGGNLGQGAGQASVLNQAEQDFMRQAAAGGGQEVALGKLAIREASAGLKPFAEQMVEDHSLANSELKTLARQLGVDLGEPPLSELARLGEKKGAAFDTEYARLMVADHEKTVALFEKESQEGVEPTLRKWALTKLPTLRHHLEMARSLK